MNNPIERLRHHISGAIERGEAVAIVEQPARDTRKAAILEALRKFINQRPGMEPGNYSDAASYRSESRSITRDRDDALRLLRDVELRDSITADDILKEAQNGRLTIETEPVWNKGTPMPEHYTCHCGLYVHPAHRTAGGIHIPDCSYARPFAAVTYCTGQYFPTEYRKAAARLMGSVLWTWTREHAMPVPQYVQHGSADNLPMSTEKVYGPQKLSAGDWLRAHFKREFGRSIANRYFN